MTEIVTLAEVKLQAEVDHDLDDELLELYRQAAEAAVIDYMDNGGLEYGAEDMPQVRLAVLTQAALLYRYRDDPDYGGRLMHGFLPFAVTALIYRQRDPTLC